MSVDYHIIHIVNYYNIYYRDWCCVSVDYHIIHTVNYYYRDCVCVSVDYHIIHTVNYYNIHYRDCGCGAGDSGCSICGCCKVCAGLKDSWGGGMSFYELQGILIIHIYIYRSA